MVGVVGRPQGIDALGVLDVIEVPRHADRDLDVPALRILDPRQLPVVSICQREGLARRVRDRVQAVRVVRVRGGVPGPVRGALEPAVARAERQHGAVRVGAGVGGVARLREDGEVAVRRRPGAAVEPREPGHRAVAFGHRDRAVGLEVELLEALDPPARAVGSVPLVVEQHPHGPVRVGRVGREQAVYADHVLESARGVGRRIEHRAQAPPAARVVEIGRGRSIGQLDPRSRGVLDLEFVDVRSEGSRRVLDVHVDEGHRVGHAAPVQEREGTAPVQAHVGGCPVANRGIEAVGHAPAHIVVGAVVEGKAHHGRQGAGVGVHRRVGSPVTGIVGDRRDERVGGCAERDRASIDLDHARSRAVVGGEARRHIVAVEQDGAAGKIQRPVVRPGDVHGAARASVTPAVRREGDYRVRIIQHVDRRPARAVAGHIADVGDQRVAARRKRERTHRFLRAAPRA